VPSAFLSGITGQFFRQFAVTIAASTVISCFVSLTLSPMLCALLLHGHATAPASRSLPARLLNAGFGAFNRGFDWLSFGYGRVTRRLVRTLGVVLVVYVGLIATAGFELSRAPPDSFQSRTRDISSRSCSCRPALPWREPNKS